MTAGIDSSWPRDLELRGKWVQKMTDWPLHLAFPVDPVGFFFHFFSLLLLLMQELRGLCHFKWSSKQKIDWLIVWCVTLWTAVLALAALTELKGPRRLSKLRKLWRLRALLLATSHYHPLTEYMWKSKPCLQLCHYYLFTSTRSLLHSLKEGAKMACLQACITPVKSHATLSYCSQVRRASINVGGGNR